MLRKIVHIDEEKCNGCGLCVPTCVEGALQIIDGKAQLVSEVYCDGLGACLGECPQGAITIEEREAEAFDLEVVEEHLASHGEEPVRAGAPSHEVATPPAACPGAALHTLHPRSASAPQALSADEEQAPSELGNWPVQLRLVPVVAPFLEGAKLVIAADCVPFAFADFHRQLLVGKTLLVGCPKLDDADFYRRKLADIFAQNDIESVDVVHMEVPCCFGLVHLVRQALDDSGKVIPLTVTKVGIQGAILETGEGK